VADQTKKGWLTSILELGAWFGVLCSGFFAEILSRKYAIIMFTGIFILGVVIQCIGVTPAGPQAVLAGRFIVGLAIGPLSMTVPLYAATL
jgi:MFS family permease